MLAISWFLFEVEGVDLEGLMTSPGGGFRAALPPKKLMHLFVETASLTISPASLIARVYVIVGAGHGSHLVLDLGM